MSIHSYVNNDNDSRNANAGHTTVQQLADSIRVSLQKVMTPGQLATACFEFERSIVPGYCDELGEIEGEGEVVLGDESAVRVPTSASADEDESLTTWTLVLGLLKMMASPDSYYQAADNPARFWQLAMVWLDSKGYGDLTLVDLHHRLAMIRRNAQAQRGE